MKIRFTQRYEVKSGFDGIHDSIEVKIERAKRGMFPKGIEAIYEEGDIVEVSDGSGLHFINRGAAVVADSEAKAKTPDEIKRIRQAEMKAKYAADAEAAPAN